MPGPSQHIDPYSGSRIDLGDSNTFRELYHRYQPGLFFLAYGMLHNQQEAEDIVAESFMKLWRVKEQFNNMEATGSWLRTTTRNACLDWLKHQKTAAHKLDQLSMQSASTEDNWQYEELLGELLQEVYNTVALLPEKSRQVFRMRYIDGLKNDQIAEQLGIQYQSVRNHLATALKMLRIRLLDKEHLLPLLLLFLRMKD